MLSRKVRNEHKYTVYTYVVPHLFCVPQMNVNSCGAHYTRECRVSDFNEVLLLIFKPKVIHFYTLYEPLWQSELMFDVAKDSTYQFCFGSFILAGFLELLNNMLTSGMVPALYPDDEKEQIIGQVRILSFK